MSLIVSPYYRNEESGRITYLEEKNNSNFNDLFGNESWRVKVWGSKTLKTFGFKILTTLVDSDIYAENEELVELKNELNDILKYKDEIIKRLKFENADSLELRVKNGLEAVKIAEQYETGGIYIG